MLKTVTVAATTAGGVIASATVAVTSTSALSLRGAQLYDTVPIVIFSASTQNVYLGGSSHTTASLGLPFAGPGYFTYNLIASDPLFAFTTNAEVSLICQGGRQSG